MAPELFRDTPVADSAADVYSFGVVLWECLTGKTPWSWLADPIQIVFAVAVEGKRLPLGVDFFETRDDDKNGADNVATRCGPTLRDLLKRCFAEDPGGRPRFQEISKVFRGL
jgi:serine/threonine protein kinase